MADMLDKSRSIGHGSTVDGDEFVSLSLSLFRQLVENARFDTRHFFFFPNSRRHSSIVRCVSSFQTK